MVFVFPILLGGLVLAGVPVLLHLIVRHRPKTLPFPAFRFLVQKRHSNVRKLRLRQLLLMALRVGLIAAPALALARPRLFQQGLGLSSERPVAAVLVFDTSASMDYRSSDGVSRLEDAKKRGQELLDELSEGSRVAVLDSADPATAKDPWQALANARKRIASLKVRPANAAVTAAVGEGYRLLADIARTRDDSKAYRFARLLCVLSDRTCALLGRQPLRRAGQGGRANPAALRGVADRRGQLTPLRELLTEHGEQSLAEAMGTSQAELRGVDPGPAAGRRHIAGRAEAGTRSARAARRERSGRRAASARRGRVPPRTAGAERCSSMSAWSSRSISPSSRSSCPRGALGEPRQLFSEGDTVELQAVVRATGKDVPVKLVWQIGETQQEVRFEARAGEAETIPVSIRTGELKLSPGPHAVELRAEPVDDLLPFDNRRFVTFAIRRKPRVLVVTDSAARSAPFARRRRSARIRGRRRAKPADAAALAGYQAVYLLGVAAPDAGAVAAAHRLRPRRRQPGRRAGRRRDEVLTPTTSRRRSALLPGRFGKKLAGTADVGSPWDWAGGDYTHPFLRRFEAWKNNPAPASSATRGAFFYWDVEPRPVETQVVIPYADKLGRPAVLARAARLEVGAARESAAVHHAARPPRAGVEQLPGRRRRVRSTSGPSCRRRATCAARRTSRTSTSRSASASPSGSRPSRGRPPYVLHGPGRPRDAQPGRARDLEITAVQTTGQLRRRGAGDGEGAGPPAGRVQYECRAGRERFDEGAGGGDRAAVRRRAVVPLERGTKVRQALEGYWSEPVELLPYVLLLLLLLLAFENLLANKFYRQEPA